MSWFGIPIELSRSELPDVVIHICWRSSRLGSLTGSSECVHRRERNQALIGSHRECPPAEWSLKQRDKSVPFAPYMLRSRLVCLEVPANLTPSANH